MRQGGFASILSLFAILAGLVASVYLVLEGPKVFKSKASADIYDVNKDGKINVLDRILVRLKGAEEKNPSPTPMPPTGEPLIVHFKMAGSQFAKEEKLTVAITNTQAKADVIDRYHDLNEKGIPNGKIIDDRPGKNPYDSQWSWHFDPAGINMVEVAIELCDARPSYVEEHLDDFLRETNGRYCPWGLEIESIEGVASPSASSTPAPTPIPTPLPTPTPTPPTEDTIVCAQVITKACKDSDTSVCQDFPTPCDVPAGWTKQTSKKEFKEKI